MRNILVLHFGQVPCVAGLPFFILIAFGLLISLLVRHFIQYACICVPPFIFMNDRIYLKVYIVNRISANLKGMLANSRQKLSAEHVYDAGCSQPGSHYHLAFMLIGYLADN